MGVGVGGWVYGWAGEGGGVVGGGSLKAGEVTKLLLLPTVWARGGGN